MTETFNVSLEQAHAYEELFVPALFAQWVPRLLSTVQPAPGESVLDVACGTGVAAREAAAVVGPAGNVSGLDLNPAMIAVAEEQRPDIDWRVGDAADLPYEAGAFDVVVCQSALFFFPDPGRAVAEMARVLRPGGRIALQTYAGLDEQPAYGPFVRVVTGLAGPAARGLLGTYWSQGDLAALRSLLHDAGLETTRAETVLGQVTFPSCEAFVHTEIHATPLADAVDAATYDEMVARTRLALSAHEQPDGGFRLPIRACFVAGRKLA